MMEIRSFGPADLDSILAIAAASPEAAAWRRDAYETMLHSPHHGACRLAELSGCVVGFICFRVVADEAEVLNLAVLPPARRQGVASRLLGEALRETAQQGARRVFLEVRDTNQPAMLFYARHGFRVASRRRGYYSDPVADALVLVRDLAGA